MSDYTNYSKEQLEIFCNNKDLEIEKIQHKLTLLTGCATFGDLDGMNGGCVYCSEEDPVLWERCHIFKYALKDFIDNYKKNFIKSYEW